LKISVEYGKIFAISVETSNFTSFHEADYHFHKLESQKWSEIGIKKTNTTKLNGTNDRLYVFL